MDYYDRKLMRSGMSYKACFFSFIGIVLLLIASFFFGRCSTPKVEGGDTLRVDSVVYHDTLVVWHTDTVPKESIEKIVEYVSIPCPEPTNEGDTAQITLPVIQKTFSDDSTYIAYVSGLEYEKWPKLDSISVRQREITNTVIKTITVQKKRIPWNIGIQAGYGYGFVYRGFEPYIGVGLSYSF